MAPEVRTPRKPAVLLETCFARFRALRQAHPEFPRVLPAGPDDPVKPMLIGISERAAALLPDGGPRKRLAKTMDTYARSIAYLEACLAPGAMRWSDDGTEPVEPVTDEQRTWVAERLARRRRWFEAQAAARQAQQARQEAEQQAAAERRAQRRQAQEEAAKTAQQLAKAQKQAPPPGSGPSEGSGIGSPQPAAARPPVVVEIRKPRRPAPAGRRPAPR
jgi:sRNA-binding protein